MHLAAKAFLQEICPNSQFKRSNGNNGKETGAEDENENEAGEADDEDWVNAMQSEEPATEGEEVEEVEEFEPGDLLGKVLALINQVRISPQAQTYFETVCKEEGLTPLQLIKWIRTQWGSMYDLIEHLVTNQAAVDKFCLIADASSKVPNLKKKKYSDYTISPNEWEMLDLIQEVLKEPREAQSSFSSESGPTVWRVIPTLELLQDCWETLAKMKKFEKLKVAIEKGLAKLRKYYTLTDQSNVYFIALEYYELGLKALEDTFDKYAAAEVPMPSHESPVKDGGYGDAMMCKAVNARKERERRGHNPHQELQNYLDSPLEDVIDRAKWWGHHSTQYPIFSHMARDYLAIQGSSTPSERSFSQ
ncbi:hypothetical protein PAXRUDRAFT_16598 [Paxillus rubicundulus Ve08.2h10]|uniref:HAT C-terminal dimerisation domain-containing protein n=1 Tax=Paxillus rubicundulus Ve08.2h10 TaxID=930991 RepID=A0A0D0CU67_9AGAM|nr:hypothetical protein PAXRUDRAFT_16598 [Paxillus rubicundulus Ve08.2h10]